MIKPSFTGSGSLDKVIHLHNSLNSNVSRENWKPGDRVYIMMDGDGSSEGQRLIVNVQDNYVRGIDTGEIISQAGLQSDGSYVRGNVYDSNGNNIQESLDNGFGGTAYSRLINRGFEFINRSTVAVRLADSAFNFVRKDSDDIIVRDWKFIRIVNTE